MKTPLLVQALFHGIATGLSLFLLACGEPSELIQDANDGGSLSHEPKSSTLPSKEKTSAPEPTPKAKTKKPGTVLWEFVTGGNVSSSPAIGFDGTVYVGSWDKKLYALSGKSGEKKWEFVTGGNVSSSPAIGFDGTVYVGSWNKELYAINPKTGVKLWKFVTGGRVDSSPAIGPDGTVYVGSWDKKLYALEGKTGAKKWEFETGSLIRSSPAIGSDGTVYVGSSDHKLYAINPKSGVKLWEFETGRFVRSSPAIGSDGTVYVGSSDKKLYAIDGKSGVKLWEFETGRGVWSSPAIGPDGTVHVGSGDKKLYAIDGKSGVKLWEFETGGGVDSSPSIGSVGTIYVGSVYPDKKLYAINGKSGVKLWEFETRGYVYSSPAIGSDGTVYIGSNDKKLYAIKTESLGLAKSPWPMRGQNAQHTSRAIAVNPPSLAQFERNSTSPGTFTVLAHNVENLFDLDGVSAYNDYKSEYYGASQLQRKLANLTNLLARFCDGSGPDVVLLQEIELDRTAERDKSAAELLAEALREKGLGPYHLVEGRIKGQSLKESPSIVCVTLSKFPVEEVHMHPLERARPILETKISVNGKPLILFNNHWKSGASSASLEKVRLGNAQVLRKRIDTLLATDPAVDVIVGGDLNSHYNQKQVYAATMPQTGVNDVLLSQGDETVMLKPTGKIYNLWHELPPEQRGSDIWKGEWGTLMHLILSHGLYDEKGIQYVTDSFRTIRLSDFNVYPETGTPRRWSNDFGGLGVSDHLPIVASFRTVSKGKPVAIGKNHSSIPRDLPQVDYSKALANAQPFTQKMATSANYGQIFSFSGNLAQQKPLTLEIDGHPIQLWSFDQLAKDKLFALKRGDKLSGYGYLSRYRGKWQLLIENTKWLIE